MDQLLSTGPTGKNADTDWALQLERQAELGSGLSLREEVVTGVDCCDFVVGEPTSASRSGADGDVDLAGCVAVGVTSPTIYAGVVTVTGASLAIAEAASSADIAGGVAVGVTSLTVAGAASPANAGVASLTDLAGGVTIGVTSSADSGVVPGRPCWRWRPWSTLLRVSPSE